MINPKTIVELIGTAILVFTIQVSGSDFAPFAIGGILIAIVFAGGPISGAHYNPAVSLAVALRGSMSFQEMIAYMIAQILGAIAGGLCGGIVSSSFSVVSMGEDVSHLQALLAEVIFTFILCYVVLSVATNPKVEDNHYYGLAIGLVVMSGAITVGPISGGAFNPAVALGLSISGGFSNLGYGIMVSASNLVGGVVAAGCFRIVVPSISEEVGTTGESTPLNTA
jgi:aquaporin Z